MEETMYLTIEDLRTSITLSGHSYPILEGINLIVPKGKIVGIVGESGCGKSMIARACMRLLKPPIQIDGGRIIVMKQNLLELKPRDLRRYQGNAISMIFQEPMTSLNPVVKVGKQVREAVQIHEKLNKAEAKKRVIEIFKKVGIPEPEKRYDAYPHELSGGLRQRVMIGMAMICKPQVLIADEPTTALDVTIEAQILQLMKKLCKEEGMSVVLITHNIGVVAQLCDEVYVMYSGQMMEHASVYEVFEHPAHPYTLGLMASVPKLDESVEYLESIPGSVPQIQQRPKGCLFSNRCPYADERCKKERPEFMEIRKGHETRCYHPQIGRV